MHVVQSCGSVASLRRILSFVLNHFIGGQPLLWGRPMWWCPPNPCNSKSLHQRYTFAEQADLYQVPWGILGFSWTLPSTSPPHFMQAASSKPALSPQHCLSLNRETSIDQMPKTLYCFWAVPPPALLQCLHAPHGLQLEWRHQRCHDWTQVDVSITSTNALYLIWRLSSLSLRLRCPNSFLTFHF